MKRNHMIRFLLFMGVIFQLSCIKDKGNYEYNSGNPVKISYPITGVLEAIIDEPVTIQPIREFTVPGKTVADYDHEWYVDGKLYSKDTDLVFNGVRSGYKVFKYYMIDKKTGVRHSPEINLGVQVISPYETGWGILYEKDGVSEIAHIRQTATGYRDQLGLYKEKNNGETLGSQPVRIKDYYVNGGRGLGIIQNGGQGTVELDGLSFEKKLVVNESFVGGAPAGLKPVNIGFYETSDLMVNSDGKLYARLFQANPIAFTVPWLNIPLEIDKGMKITHLWDVWTSTVYFTMMYDELNNRLLYASLKLLPTHTAGGVLKIETVPPPPVFMPVPPTYINPSNPLTGYDYVWGGTFNDGGFSAACAFLVRDKISGEMYLQTFNFLSLMGLQTMHTPMPRQTFTGKQFVTPASKFVAIKLRNYLFFSGDADNKGLYYYDLSTQGATKLYHHLPAEITVLRQSDNGQQLAVGLTDGTVIFYDISNQAMLSGGPVELHRVSGLGRIADITVRGGSPI